MSLRILGGTAKGRSLQVPDSARPSGARVRKSLFDLLSARAPAGRYPRFIDLHGGSGAIGLEAASRGYSVTLVERDARAVRALEANARALDLRVRIVKGDAAALLGRLGPFEVVFSDPPYDADIPALTLKLLRSGVVAPAGLLVCQHPDRARLPDHAGFTREVREYGSNSLTLYWRGAGGAAGEGASVDEESGAELE
ncbi:RsmD family RNA methyltransferase [Deinococcus taeanensis]|uniref:RsmD family RNA methyltransferase n=1 Tax=Deinococcus taeanensis TaxID=2737050 RepID=UPI001CDD7039|nr:RsmD family RNA methyltransferase [Deinococcus taeanensis]UBV42641.1 RsmD family RNA methyltransferase [Deinococcus taeanensis]